jgi:hypothetical protein
LLPSDLDEVMAMSSRNCLFVSVLLLGDPYDTMHPDDVTMVVGNVGRTGIALMVAPKVPRVKKLPFENWNVGSRRKFAGPVEFGFPSTSLHLSFTEYELPFDIDNCGDIGNDICNDICIVETLISVLDYGKWIADIDVLALFRQESIHLQQVKDPHSCRGHGSDDASRHDLIAFDSWTDNLDAQEDLGDTSFPIVRVGDN